MIPLWTANRSSSSAEVGHADASTLVRAATTMFSNFFPICEYRGKIGGKWEPDFGWALPSAQRTACGLSTPFLILHVPAYPFPVPHYLISFNFVFKCPQRPHPTPQRPPLRPGTEWATPVGPKNAPCVAQKNPPRPGMSYSLWQLAYVDMLGLYDPVRRGELPPSFLFLHPVTPHLALHPWL